jgi:hydrophobe/amphiphile efflux-1 (HAE1) family protein
MNFNVSAWSIRNPVPPVVLFVVLCFLGAMSFMTLPVTRFPNIDVPVISVTVTQSGAAPSELETQVTRRIEDAVANLTGVKNVISTVTDGQSLTAIEFRLEVNTDRALNDVKDAIAKIRAELPRSIDEPVVERVNVENQSIVTYAASAPQMTPEQLSWHVDDVVRRQLQGLRGVGRVDRVGGVEREIHIRLDPDRLASLGVTAGEVNRQVRATSVDLAGGRTEIAGQEQSVRTLASARSIEELSATRIVLSGGREVRLGDIGEVRDAWVEPRSFARLDGDTPIVSFSIYRAKGASDVDVNAVVTQRMAELQRQFPNIRYSRVDDSVRYTRGNYDATMHTLMEGAALAVIVVFVFLRDWRATLITALTLPLAAIPTFFVMAMLGFSLNLVSLLAITLVTGILVDDAIVEIENIVRHQRMGKSPYRAAMEAADEIGLAVIAITMTIVAIFAPVSFMGGIAGQYFKQFGLTVAIAVLFSLLVARLITPMLAAYFMRAKPHAEPKDGALMRAYTGFLGWTLRWRFLTLGAGVALFAVSIWAIRLLPTGFVPAADASRIVVSMELPPGSTLDDTRERTDRLAREIRASVPEVRSVFVIGGATPTGTREIRRAAVFVILAHKSERSRTQKQIEAALAGVIARVPDARAWYVNERGERELNVTLVSNDPAALNQAVANVETAMRREPSFLNVAAAAGVERPEVRVVPRFDDAARYGVSTEAISEAVRIATIGDAGANLARFNAGDRLVSIRVQLDTAARGDLSVLETLPVTTPTGAQVPLAAVADIRLGQGPSSIERLNRQRRVSIGADLTGGMQLGQAVERVAALPEMQNLPAGVAQAQTGDAEIMGEVFMGFFTAMVTGLLLVLGVLILLFGSVFQPVTILLSLPLSIGGVILGLLLTNNAVSMPVVIGILMLMGIVTKNAILLVDFAIEEVKGGVPRAVAIVDAGRKRARPIIMTTIAMVAGMVPTALGIGDGGEFRSPMAIAVIGGLIVSTALSLVFVPSFYTVMDDVGRFFAWLFGRFVGPKEEDAPPPALATATALTALPAGPPVPANEGRRRLPPAAE